MIIGIGCGLASAILVVVFLIDYIFINPPPEDDRFF